VTAATEVPATAAPGSGSEALPAPVRRLLTSAGLCASGLALSSVFVTLFFYVTTGSLANMALWSAGRYLGLIAASIAVVTLAPDVSPRRLFRIGLVASAGFYALLVLLGARAGAMAFPLGLTDGAASGIYWFGNNTLVYDTVPPAGRGRYYGVSFGLQSLVNVVMPVLAGVVVAGIGGTTGYLAVFGLTLVAFAAAGVSARSLPDGAPIGRIRLGEVLALPFRRSRWGATWLTLALRGFKQAAGGLGLIALVWLAVRSPAAQGDFAALSALAGVVTSVAVGRVPARWRAAAMWVGAGGFAVATVLIAGRPELSLLLAYGLVTGLIYPGVMVPVAAVVLEVMDEDPEAASRRGGYVLSREIAANVGRLVAVGLLMGLLAIAPAHLALVAVLTVAALLQLVVAALGSHLSHRVTLAA